MPEYLHPGVYVEEGAPSAPRVATVGTGIAGFVGPTEMANAGEDDLTGRPVPVTSFQEFERLFGGIGPIAADGSRLFAMAESVRLFFDNGGGRCVIVSTGGFTDGDGIRAPRVSEFRRGVRALRDAPDVAFFAVPDAALMRRAPAWARIARYALDFARNEGRFALIDIHRGDRPADGADDPIDGPDGLRALIDGDARGWGAAYWPWLVPADGAAPLPPCGAIAGVYARTDATRGVWKAPANAPLAGVARLTEDVTREGQERLNAPDKAINAIRTFSGRGILVWGARTLAGGEYRYVPVRRLMLMVERSLREWLQFAAVEPNAPSLWKSVEARGGAFLFDLWRQGALAGSRADEAFFIRCGLGRSMTQADLDAGRLVVEVGVAPLKPAEFVILRITRPTGS